jgi:hypothetical protein
MHGHEVTIRQQVRPSAPGRVENVATFDWHHQARVHPEAEWQTSAIGHLDFA